MRFACAVNVCSNIACVAKDFLLPVNTCEEMFLRVPERLVGVVNFAFATILI